MLQISQYSPDQQAIWDKFALQAKNSTFLHQRGFMDYHADRFVDNSLLVWNNRELVAILPANRIGDELFSHAGLTYGDLLVCMDSKLKDLISYWAAVLAFLDNAGISTLYYKSVPAHYHRGLGLEEQYIFFLINAEIYRCDTCFVIDNQQFSGYNHRRTRSIKKAAKHQHRIENTDFVQFWEEILIPNLEERFGVKPVHSLQEISLLKSRFPENIFQYNIFLDEKIAAGVTIFKTDTTAHAQYISTNEWGKSTGAVDLLFDYLIREAFADLHFFSFGIANEQQGKALNWGLTEWKESFNPLVFPQQFYKIDTKMWERLEKM
jgi:hypothetical protein